MKTSSIILLVAIAVFAVTLGVNFAGNSSTYTDFADAKRTGDNVHIVGEWVLREQAAYDPNRDIFRFAMRDTMGTTTWVQYNDPEPQNFDKAEKVLVIGQYEGDYFRADKIQTKCPSKYEETEIKAEK